MATVGRLAGALLAQSGAQHYLVGNPKEPCAWADVGFEPPGEVDALLRPYVRLAPTRAIAIATPCLQLALEGEALPRLLSAAFAIERTGMISERLWRLVTGDSDERECSPDAVVDAGWLAQMPPAIWAIVRESVLRCS
ncbi:MAG TPA: precorrin-3B C(17)-methyltransferase [Polyangiales bacterium]|nr:precorrin-3B C(17)-methyltransferase [Polyangiales bacterium]